MKVLRVIGGVDPAMGGPSVSSVNACIAAQRAGIKTTVVFPVDEWLPEATSATMDVLRKEDAEVQVFPLSGVSRARRWGISLSLAHWVFKEAGRYDVIHAHGGWTVSTAAALVAARVARRPAVLTPHESLTEFDIEKSRPAVRATKRLIRLLYRRWFDLIVVSSEMERRDTMGGTNGRSAVIYHPVVASEPTRNEEDGRTPSQGRIGFLGRLDPKKNADVLIRALKLLPPSVTLRIAGEGPLEQELRRVGNECGVSDRIEWLGFIAAADKASFFGSIDVLAMPSANECFGVSAAEAMVHGVPIVISPRVGLVEVIEPSGAGLVVGATMQQLADGLAALIEDRSLQTRLRTRAKETAAREFSFEAHGARIRDAYEQLLHAGTSANEASRSTTK